MINTYHTSVAPPVPPRLHSSHGAQPVLIPTPLPQGPSKPLMRFMVTVVLLNLLMTVVGMIYLYINSKQGAFSSSAGTDPQFSMQTQLSDQFMKEDPENYKKHKSSHSMREASLKAFAQMVVQSPSTLPEPKSGHLQWDTKQSRLSLPHINYFNSSWITIEKSADYCVYSRVTFSRAHRTRPLINRVMLRKTYSDEEKILMEAYCHFSESSLCTATTYDVFKLEKGNQLSVWTEDLSLVDFTKTATAFGLHNLW